MRFDVMKRLFCAALAAALLCPAALAENPSDDVSGYNPFDPEGSAAAVFNNSTAAPAQSAQSDNPFGGEDLTLEPGYDAGAAVTATELFGTNAGSAASTDPFGTGTANTASTDPFGTGVTNTASADPFGAGAANTAASDPFGTGTAAAAPAASAAPAGTSDASNPFGAAPTLNVGPTATPLPSIGGYNPFDNSQAQVAIPMNAVMFVKDASLKLRAKADENSRIVTTVFFGQQLTVIATQGDWAQVQSPSGVTAYCLYNGLSNADPNVLNRQMYVQLNTTPLYKAPSQKMGRLRNLKKGDVVTLLAITSDGLWSRVSDGQNFGFIPTIYLDDTPAAEGTQVWCLNGSTAVMVNPDSWIQISSLSFGQSAYLVGYTANNTIAKIRSAKGYVAYCDASALTTVDPANLDTLVYVQATGKLLCTTTDAKAKINNVNKNVQFKLLGVDGSQYWALVKQGKRKAYIPFIYVNTQRLGNASRVVVATQDAPLYNSTDPNSGVLGTLPMGARMTLVGGNTQYAQVATITDGTTPPTTGYVPIEYLRGE